MLKLGYKILFLTAFVLPVLLVCGAWVSTLLHFAGSDISEAKYWFIRSVLGSIGIYGAIILFKYFMTEQKSRSLFLKGIIFSFVGVYALTRYGIATYYMALASFVKFIPNDFVSYGVYHFEPHYVYLPTAFTLLVTSLFGWLGWKKARNV